MKTSHFTTIGIVSMLLNLIASVVWFFIISVNGEVDIFLSSNISLAILNGISALGLLLFFLGYFLRQKQWTKFKITNLICLVMLVGLFCYEIIPNIKYGYWLIFNNYYSIIFAIFSLGLFLSKPQNILLQKFSLITFIVCALKFFMSFIVDVIFYFGVANIFNISFKFIMLLSIIAMLSVMLKVQTKVGVLINE